MPEFFLRLVGVPRVDQGDETREDPLRVQHDVSPSYHVSYY